MYKTITQIEPNLFLSDWAGVEAGEVRREFGITATVAILESPALPYTEQIETEAFVLIHQWDGQAVDPKTCEHFLAEMERLTAENRTIVIHCLAGISRTPSFTILWQLHRILQGVYFDCQTGDSKLVMRLGLSALWSTLEDQIRQVRPWSQPHANLKRSILEFLEARVNAGLYQVRR